MTNNMKIKLTIETGIPISPYSTHKDMLPVPPWLIGDLEVGQSVLLPPAIESKTSCIGSRLYYWGKKLSKKFTYRKVEGGHRIWRVE